MVSLPLAPSAQNFSRFRPSLPSSATSPCLLMNPPRLCWLPPSSPSRKPIYSFSLSSAKRGSFCEPHLVKIGGSVPDHTIASEAPLAIRPLPLSLCPEKRLYLTLCDESRHQQVGLRVEHPQELINIIQYSKLASEVRGGRGKVPVVDYKVAKHVKGKDVDSSPSLGTNCACYFFYICLGRQGPGEKPAAVLATALVAEVPKKAKK